MKFILRRTSDYSSTSEIEINNLEELMQFKKDVNKELIIGNYDYGENKGLSYIEIYDDWRE